MGRCGCGATVCACNVQGTNGIEVSGNGSASSPFIAELALGTGTSGGCDQVMDCVGSNLGNGLAYSDPQIYADLSSDTANMTAYGTDNGIYTPPTAITAGTSVTISGNGTATNPYVVNAASEIGDTALTAGDGIAVTGTGIATDPFVVAQDPYVVRAHGVQTSYTPVPARTPTPLPLVNIQRAYPAEGAWSLDEQGGLVCTQSGLYWAYVAVTFASGTGVSCVVQVTSGGKNLIYSPAYSSPNVAFETSLIEVVAGQALYVRALSGSGTQCRTPIIVLARVAPLPDTGAPALESDPIAQERAAQYETGWY